MERIDTKGLNFLRFVAICIVAFFWHYQHFAPTHGSPLGSVFCWSYDKGLLMVDLFFMLSGFGMYLGYADKIINRQISFKDYIIRRIRKLYPLHLFTLLLITALEYWHISLNGKTFVFGDFDPYHFILNLLLCQTGIVETDYSFNGPAWCITILLLLYIIMYMAIYFSRTLRTAHRALTFLIFFLVGTLLFLSGVDYPCLLNFEFATGLSCFSLGVLLAMIHLKSNRFNTKLIGYMGLFIVVLMYTLFRIDRNLIFDLRIVFNILVAPSIIFCVLYIPWLNRLFSLRPMQYLGSISFPIYLLHFSIQCAIADIGLAFDLKIDYSGISIWLIYPAVSILLSVLYKKFIDRHVYALTGKIFRIGPLIPETYHSNRPITNPDVS